MRSSCDPYNQYTFAVFDADILTFCLFFSSEYQSRRKLSLIKQFKSFSEQIYLLKMQQILIALTQKMEQEIKKSYEYAH